MRNKEIEKLFISKYQIRIIDFFIRHEKLAFYESEVAHKLHLKRSTVADSLKRLVKLGFLRKILTRYKTFYKINKTYRLFSILKQLFGLNLSKKRRDYS